MEKLGLNEIRDKFRDFFVSKGHYAGGSASLIPRNDKSLMIINSGMAPLKPYFAGVETPPCKRMTTCQKCIRTNDIENVGKTSRHGTFFEMLGNFSFGDYFKEQSLAWGWEFITEWLELPKDKIWATIYENDDEAHDIWIKLGMPEERIVRLGKEDNFWEIGLGPCGPCSEIYYDRGEEYGCGNPDCKPGCDCDRYIEFWNHVFTQFSKEEDGSYSDLEHPNIDTGMGLERMACIMQGVDSIFDVDTIRHILTAVTDMAGVEYQAGNHQVDVSVRIITDHLRSMVFMIADGILPSNEGRGYILKRIIRRAARHGRLLGITDNNFLVELSNKVIEVSGEAYPELLEKKEYLQKIIQVESENFAKTLDKGLGILDEYIAELKAGNIPELDGKRAFKLYDTYGFPVEVTSEILEDNGMSVDIDSYNDHMQKQKELAQENQRDTDDDAWRDSSEYSDLPQTVFAGYDRLQENDAVIQFIGDYDRKRKFVIFDRTTFYATGGGQTYDTGRIYKDDDSVKVVEVVKENGIFLHIIDENDTGVVMKYRLGDTAELKVDAIRRHKIAKGHSCTHLLQQALRDVLGEHVMQAGSNVEESSLRFDFNHFQPVTVDEIKKVEDIVNERINEFLPICMKEMPIDEARELGAMAIFGEKYGNIVRVVSMGDYSVEFCGGTHLSNTGLIGAFKITSEAGIASGVRRIEAVTGNGVVDYLESKQALLANICMKVRANENDVVRRTVQLVSDVKSLENKIKELKEDEIADAISSLIDSAVEVGDVRLITRFFENGDGDQLRKIADAVNSKVQNVINVFATSKEGRVMIVISVSEDLIGKGYHAGKIIKEVAAAAGGSGGGKANMAQAGARDASKVEDAFEKAKEILQK